MARGAARHDRGPLLAFLRVQRAGDREMLAELRRASERIVVELRRLEGRTGTGVAVRRDQLGLARAAILRETADLWRRLGRSIEARQADAAAAAIESAYPAAMLRRVMPAADVEYLLRSARASAREHAATLSARLALSQIPLAQSVYRNQALASGKIDAIINDAIARGASAKELARDVLAYIRPDVPGGMSYAAMRLGRTELNNAFHAQQVLSGIEAPWTVGQKWNLSRSHPVRDVCNDNAESVHYEDGEPGVYLPADVPGKPHPQCFPAGTRVSAGEVRAASRRWYSGQLVEVSTAGAHGEKLAGTPNHPALTTRGWVPLAELREGDHLIRRLRRDGVTPAVGPHDEQVEPRIEDLFAALREAGGVPAATVPPAPEQFHGDGSIGHVHVVRADGSLSGAAGEHVEDELLAGGRLLRPFDGEGAPAQRLIGHRDAPARGVSGGSHRGDLLGRVKIGGLLAGAQREPGPPHRPADYAGADVEGARRLLERLAGEVELDEITVTRRIDFTGHVYNLETGEGWYTASSYVVHNCLCFLTPETVDRDLFLDQFMAGDYDRFIDRVIRDGGITIK